MHVIPLVRRTIICLNSPYCGIDYLDENLMFVFVSVCVYKYTRLFYIPQ